MSSANASLNKDHMLRDTCSWAARSSASETDGDVTPVYASAATLRCNIAQPSSRWVTRYPDIDLTASQEFWLPAASTVARRDKITHGGVVYFVQEVADWQGAGRSAIATSHAGIT